MGTFSKVCIKETAGPGPGICRRESQQAEMRGPGRDGPYGDPKLLLGSKVQISLSRYRAPAKTLVSWLGEFLGTQSWDLQELSVMFTAVSYRSQGPEKTAFYVCYAACVCQHSPLQTQHSGPEGLDLL